MAANVLAPKGRWHFGGALGKKPVLKGSWRDAARTNTLLAERL